MNLLMLFKSSVTPAKGTSTANNTFIFCRPRFPMTFSKVIIPTTGQC